MSISFYDRYLENKGVDASVKPVVWIAWLFIFPMLQTMAFESYMFISVRCLPFVIQDDIDGFRSCRDAKQSRPKQFLRKLSLSTLLE